MPEDVLGNETETPVVPAGQGKEQTYSKADYESAIRDRDEARQSEKYWAGLARNNTGRTAEPATVDDGPNASEFLDDADLGGGLEGDTPEKFVDDFASQGSKAISARGFVTKAEAQRMATEAAIKVSRELIGRERQKMSTDDVIIKEFGEGLKDRDSDLYKETAKRYQRAVAIDPNATKSAGALYLAAESAREFLERKKAEPEDERETESDRRQRAASQDARPRGRGEAEGTETLGPEAKQLISSFGITDAEFRASQKTYGRPAGGRR